MKKLLFLSFLLGFFGVAFYVSSLSVFDIDYPIAELGGCADRQACKAYCNDSANADACFAFAKKYGLADQTTVKKAEVVERGGPGNCKGAEECRQYCDDPSHEDECLEFAVQNGFMTKAEVERIRKPGPGGCRGRQCEQYCSDPAHEEECLEYAAVNGLISKEEAERIKQFKQKFKQGQGGPGGCQSEDQCRNYCDDPAHMQECVEFAEREGLIPKEEAARIKRMGPPEGPGGCRGKEACDAYCSDPANELACIDFAEQNGFISPQEAEIARKMAGKTGPGGCRGRQCKDYCADPAHEEECLQFAKDNGLIPPEEIARIEKFRQVSQEGGPGGCRGRQCQDYCADPAHQEECFNFAKNKGLVNPEDEKRFEVGRKLNEKLKEAGGPGGCRNDGECRQYCSDPSHTEECVAFAASHGGIPAEQARQMLREFTEKRFGPPGEFGPPQDFRRFEEEARRRFEEFRQLEQQFRGQPFPGFPGGPGGPPPGQAGFPSSPGEFPGGEQGQPGRFGSGPGEGRFPGGFVGPGGCTSPVECIKYCSEHKDECFGVTDPFVGGPIGGPMRGPQEPGGGGFGGEAGMPRLKSNLIQEFKPEELPEDFQQKSFEERQRFFMEKFGPPPGGEGGFPGRGGEGGFPGRPGEGFPGGAGGQGFQGRPGEFPGRPGEFPGGSFEGIGPRPGTPGIFGPVERPEGFMPPEGFRPPEGLERHPFEGMGPLPGTPGVFGPFPQPRDFRAPGEFPQSPEGFRPPEGTFQQPSSSGGTFAPPPPSGTIEQPPPPSTEPAPLPPPPSGQAPKKGFFASIADFFR